MLEVKDERTKRYLNAIKEHLGVLGYNHGWVSITEFLDKKGVEDEEIDEFTIAPHLGTVKVITYERDGQKRYAAYWHERVGLDDYDAASIVFNRRPSKHDVFIANMAELIEDAIALNRLQPTFRCRKCNRETHWLDNPEGDLEEKYYRLYDKYCGC